MAGPVPPTRRRERLASLNDAPSLSSYQAPRVQPVKPAPSKTPAEKCCDRPNISTDEDGSQVCYSCASVLHKQAIVADITFGENAAGAAIVQGGFVGENQRHANSMGGTVRGDGTVSSRQQTEANGLTEIKRLCSALMLPERIEQNAFNWYKLALNHNFVQGRRIRNVASVAIYLAARKQETNTLMLLDLAEKIHTNIWRLGDTYKQFCKTIMESDPAQLSGSMVLQEIEPLMLKFCRKLEFGNASHKVADDACKILKRMKRDWMVQGRNPAGLCGACIILAARMNNYRRTVREVVYIVKVADTTINQRLYEYNRTPSSALTVAQFREHGQRLKVKTLPPAIWRRAEKELRADKRKRKHDVLDNEEEDEAVALVGPQGDEQTSEATPQDVGPKRRKTGNGKAGAAPSQNEASTDATLVPVPNMTEASLDDVDLSLDASTGSSIQAEVPIVIPRKRGRPKKSREPIVVKPEDLEIEADLEREILSTVKDWESTFRQFEDNENHEVLMRTSHRARQLAVQHMPNANISTEQDIGEDEFEDDEDVRTCILSEQEVIMKERIWISMNEDWLREQQAKLLAAALEEAKGKPKKAKQTRKRSRMGDGSLLADNPVSSAAEAVHKMLKARAKHFSNAIDYESLQKLLPGAGAALTKLRADNDPALGSSSASPNVPGSMAASPRPPVAEKVDEDEDEEEFEEEVTQYVDDEESEHEYRSDSEQGFGDDDPSGF